MSHAPVNATELSCAEYTEELTQFRMGLLDEADAERLRDTLSHQLDQDADAL